jgi:hypothetical protein
MPSIPSWVDASMHSMPSMPSRVDASMPSRVNAQYAQSAQQSGCQYAWGALTREYASALPNLAPLAGRGYGPVIIIAHAALLSCLATYWDRGLSIIIGYHQRIVYAVINLIEVLHLHQTLRKPVVLRPPSSVLRPLSSVRQIHLPLFGHRWWR